MVSSFHLTRHTLVSLTHRCAGKSLLARGVLNRSLFDQDLAEVVSDDDPRYILRHNPIRAAEMGESRQNKLGSVQRQVDRQNKYLQEHAKAHVQVAVDKIVTQCRKLRLDAWVQVTVQERVLALTIDESALAEQQKRKTNVSYCK